MDDFQAEDMLKVGCFLFVLLLILILLLPLLEKM